MFFNRKVFVPERRRPIKTIKTIDCLHHFGTIAYYPVPQNTLCAWIMKKKATHTHTHSFTFMSVVSALYAIAENAQAHCTYVWSIQDVYEMKIWSNARQNNVFRERTLCICSIGFSVTIFLNASNENGLTQSEKERRTKETTAVDNVHLTQPIYAMYFYNFPGHWCRKQAFWRRIFCFSFDMFKVHQKVAKMIALHAKSICIEWSCNGKYGNIVASFLRCQIQADLICCLLTGFRKCK